MPIRDGVRVFTEDETPQGSEAWRTTRLGVLTGSRCAPILVDETKKVSTGRANLLMEIVIEVATGRTPKKDIPQTDAVVAGIEREPDAIRRFESETFDFVKRVGFCYWVGKRVGCSPDGVLGDFDALVSIKCRELSAHYKHIRTGFIDAAALRQMAHELWVTGAEKHNYVSFNPFFERALQYRRVELLRDDPRLRLAEYITAAEAFLRDVDTALASMRTLASATPFADSLAAQETDTNG